jgi:hypothetical protein
MTSDLSPDIGAQLGPTLRGDSRADEDVAPAVLDLATASNQTNPRRCAKTRT